MAPTIIDGTVITVKSIYDLIVDGVSPYTKAKWRAIAIALEVPEDEIENIDSDINIKKIELREVGTRVLQCWFDNSDEDEATIEKLIEVLEGVKMKKSANKLRAKYENPTGASSGIAKVTTAESVKPKEDDYDKRLNKFMKDNLPELQTKTLINSTVLAILNSKDVISDDDQGMLNAIPTKSERNLKFYKEILPNKVGYFQILLKAMDETRQSGVLAILKKFQE
ncbi:unnamed protein product [Orchesella dallaii]|uniref:Death domain-containing protein n=1 Tax=Orchesella dallaii TaxID=48710 RepID=A0ABP1PUI2_9HEXA